MMSVFAFLFQNDWQKYIPGGVNTQPLERFPATLSLIFLGGSLAVLFFVTLLFMLRRKPASAIEESELPDEVRRKLGSRSTNFSLWIFRIAFTIMALAVFGTHVYWTLYAGEYNERFGKLQTSSRDPRNRRLDAFQLRGWIYDRTGKLDNILAYWKVTKEKSDEDLLRAYPFDSEFSHLLGTEIGSPGLDRVLFNNSEDVRDREAYEWLQAVEPPKDEQKDVKITISKDLQLTAAQQFKEKKKYGAIVVLNPQTGEVLTVFSNPSFSLTEARDRDKLVAMEDDEKNKPLVNRATREFYVPGSTFKTFTMIGAYRNGKSRDTFQSNPPPECFTPFRGSKAICDANGSCEGPYGCALLTIDHAFEASSNQYFSQLANDLGLEKLRENAKTLGIHIAETPEDTRKVNYFGEIWNASSERIKGALAPTQSTMVLGKGLNAFDIGLEGMGQGYAGQMTPFQMALIASAVGNTEGKLMKPKIEFDRPPEMFSQVVTPQQAAEIRAIMNLVTEGTGGTATRVFAPLKQAGIRAGGKTGTAERLVPVFDAQGKRVFTIKKRKDKNGNIIERKIPVLKKQTDSWFICLAPIENPQIAIAVVAEAGGFGATTAAPIAAKMVLKARDLGLLGEAYTPKTAPPAAPKPRVKRP